MTAPESISYMAAVATVVTDASSFIFSKIKYQHFSCIDLNILHIHRFIEASTYVMESTIYGNIIS